MHDIIIVDVLPAETQRCSSRAGRTLCSVLPASKRDAAAPLTKGNLSSAGRQSAFRAAKRQADARQCRQPHSLIAYMFLPHVPADRLLQRGAVYGCCREACHGGLSVTPVAPPPGLLAPLCLP